MPRKRRSVPTRVVERHAERIEQVRQSPALYATTPETDEVAGFVFAEHMNLLAMTGRGVGRARQWRAYLQATQKPQEELPAYAFQPASTYSDLNEAFAMARVQAVAEQALTLASIEQSA